MMRFLIDDASFAAMMRNASAIGFDALLSAPYNNHIAMNPRNETHVARFKALVELGNQNRKRVFFAPCCTEDRTFAKTSSGQT